MIDPREFTRDQRRVLYALRRTLGIKYTASSHYATVEEIGEHAAGVLPRAACGTRAWPPALIDLVLRQLAEQDATVEIAPGQWTLHPDIPEELIEWLPYAITELRSLTHDQRAVLYALRIVTGQGGFQRATADLLQTRTADKMTRLADGQRAQPMGLARIRRTLRELAELGLVVEAKRGWWAVHPDGAELATQLVTQ